MLNQKSALAIALAIALAACGGDDTAPAGTPGTPAGGTPAAGRAPVLAEGATAQMVEQGGQLFRGNGNCHACHGPDAAGTVLAPSLRDENWLNSDGSFASIQQVIRTGVANPVEHPAPMPAMGGVQLSDDQIRDLAAYIYSISRGG